MGTGDEGRGTGERGSRGAVAVGDVGGGSRDAPAARSPGRPVLGRHADTERAQRRRRRVASVPPDDRGREPVGRGHWEDAARRLDRRVLRAPGMETGDSAAWLRRRRAAGSPPARSRGGGGGNPDRAGAAAARAGGARVLVLDDAYQLLGVARDVNVAVLSAESWAGSPWPLLAGPWRERWEALDRADLIVVTRKHAPAAAAADIAAWLARRRPRTPVAVAWLALEHLEGVQSGTRPAVGILAGQDVVAAAGIADPTSFAAQLSAAGARVQLLAYQ